jgi:hypothetical protein
MGIAAMGVRSALRTIQDNVPPDADGKAKLAVTDVLAIPGETSVLGKPTKADPGDRAASKLEELAAWIPTETLALWIGIVSAFSLFDDTTIEATVGGILLLFTGVLGYVSSLGAHNRREIADRRKAVSTGLVAAIAFGIYWMSMPGSLATADLNVHPVFPALLLGLSLIFLPMVARALKIEPQKP